jgi:Protein of unknown function (DUF3363)
MERLEARRTVDVRRELVRARLYEPRMGVVRGEVREMGPRGEDPERAALVIDAGYQGRILLNTSMDAIANLQKGALVALHPEGRRASVERLAYHPVRDQVLAIADTALDRELDRRSRGEARGPSVLGRRFRFPAARALAHERGGLGDRDEAGVFHFRDGVRDSLRQAELDRLGRETERDTLKQRSDPSLTPHDAWKVRDVVELHAGPTAVLERGRGYALAPVAPGEALKAGDRVVFREAQTPERDVALDVARDMARDVGRDIGRHIAASVSPALEVVRSLGRDVGRDR